MYRVPAARAVHHAAGAECKGSARKTDGDDKKRSRVPQPHAPLRGAGGVVLRRVEKAPSESRAVSVGAETNVQRTHADAHR